jgi:hypothetical protein
MTDTLTPEQRDTASRLPDLTPEQQYEDYWGSYTACVTAMRKQIEDGPMTKRRKNGRLSHRWRLG